MKNPEPGSGPVKKSALSLWLWVLAGFLGLGICWVAMFKAANSAHIREVPLTTKGGKP